MLHPSLKHDNQLSNNNEENNNEENNNEENNNEENNNEENNNEENNNEENNNEKTIIKIITMKRAKHEWQLKVTKNRKLYEKLKDTFGLYQPSSNPP